MQFNYKIKQEIFVNSSKSEKITYISLFYILFFLLLNSINSKLNHNKQSTHWCSIWKFRCPVNQSLKIPWSTLHVEFNCDVNQSSFLSISTFIGIWLICVTQTNQWLSINLKREKNSTVLWFNDKKRNKTNQQLFNLDLKECITLQLSPFNSQCMH